MEATLLWAYSLIGCWLVCVVPNRTSAIIRPPADSGCDKAIKNYGCYCPGSQRIIPSKCTDLFDEEIIDSSSGFATPVSLTYPTLSPHLRPIVLTAATICIIHKFCEIRVSPMNNDWKIIDWCITTESSNYYHLQLLGPPHSPVCCDVKDDQKYTMMCMRMDMNIRRFIDTPLLISLYIKLLPRAPINFRLSLVLLDAKSVGNQIPDEFHEKTNHGGAPVTLLTVEDMILDLSSVKKWEDL